MVINSTLLDARLLAAAAAGTLVVVNSAQAPGHFARALPAHRVVPVDAIGISLRCGLGRIVNSALLGALARAVGSPALASLERTIAERSPKLTQENLAECEEGFRAADELLGEGVAA